MTKEANENSSTIVETKVAEDSASGSKEKKDDEKVAAVATNSERASVIAVTVDDSIVDKDDGKKEETEEKGSTLVDAEDSIAVDAVAANDSVEADVTMDEEDPTSATRKMVSTIAAEIAASADVELTANFPQKLTDILSNEEYKDIIHWLPHGKGFIIADKKRFGDEVLPKYFKKAKFTSFTRKLNRWNFVRITRGPEVGSYYHPNFQRDDPKSVSQMTCIGSKQPQALKPLDPIALGLLPLDEAADASTKQLGGIQQWQPQDHERYRLFYQQSHWNYMMQVMQQQQQAAATAAVETSKESDTAGDDEATATTSETKDALKVETAIAEAPQVLTAEVSNDAAEAPKEEAKNNAGKTETTEIAVKGEEI